MSIKRGERVTQQKLEKEQRRYRKVASIYEKPHLTKIEQFISNYHRALAEVILRYEDVVLREGKGKRRILMEKEYIEVLLWLYQFEYFEMNYVLNNIIYVKDRKNIYGTEEDSYSKFAGKKITVLKETGYIEKIKTKIGYQYKEWEQKDNFIRLEQKESTDKYRLSEMGVGVVRAFYEALSDDSMSAKYKKNTKMLIWSTQTTNDFNDFEGF